MENMKYWDQLKQPPTHALKKISGGRINGMTDINPQWRLEAMTQAFGPIGIGWAYKVNAYWLEEGANEEKAAFCSIELKYKHEGEWSEWIPGIGGSMLITKERSGPRTSDEAYKMALTDALSVAMKQIGVAADIYRGFFDGSKYNVPTEAPKAEKPAFTLDPIAKAPDMASLKKAYEYAYVTWPERMAQITQAKDKRKEELQ